MASRDKKIKAENISVKEEQIKIQH